MVNVLHTLGMSPMEWKDSDISSDDAEVFYFVPGQGLPAGSPTWTGRALLQQRRSPVENDDNGRCGRVSKDPLCMMIDD